MAVGSQRRPCSASEKRGESLDGEVNEIADDDETCRTRKMQRSPKLLLKTEQTWAAFCSMAVDRKTDTARRGDFKVVGASSQK